MFLVKCVLFMFIVVKKLQEKLCEMETELWSIRQAAQNQERTIQNLTDSLSTKDSEVNTHMSCFRVNTNSLSTQLLE